MFQAKHVHKQRLNFFKKSLPIAYDFRFYALLKRSAIAKIWCQLNYKTYLTISTKTQKENYNILSM